MSVASPAGSLSVLFADLGAGAPGARNALLAGLQQNLTRLTAAILTRHFPVVARRRAVESVVQDLNCALLRATDAGFRPADVKEVVTYSARCLRSLLTDEAAKIRRRKDYAPQAAADEPTGGPPERAADDDSASVLVQWGEFQRRLGELSDDELVVFDLHFHQKVPQSEIAELLGLTPKQVSRAWLAVARKLRDHLPRFDTPKRVLLLAGGDDYTRPAARALFDGWRAFPVTPAGGADRGTPVGREALDRADVIAVTRPEYAERARAAGKPVVCLDLPDAFDPADPAAVNALWRALTTKLAG